MEKEGEARCQIDEALDHTITAFVARWLPLTTYGHREVNFEYSLIVQTFWRRARRHMLRLINKPSYRSMMALFLFSVTPIPTGISEDEEMDGVSGQVCVHAGLQQIQALRASQRSLQYNGSKDYPSQQRPTTNRSIATLTFLTYESIAYWAALTFDVSSSLTLNCRPLLSSGLFGYVAEAPWKLIQTASKHFQGTDAGRQGEAVTLINDESANEIIANASAWKLLTWKLTSVFKEAIREGHDEAEVVNIHARFVDATKHFEEIYQRPLAACQRRIQFLKQETKLRWCECPASHWMHILCSFIMFITNTWFG